MIWDHITHNFPHPPSLTGWPQVGGKLIVQVCQGNVIKGSMSQNCLQLIAFYHFWLSVRVNVPCFIVSNPVLLSGTSQGTFQRFIISIETLAYHSAIVFHSVSLCFQAWLELSEDCFMRVSFRAGSCTQCSTHRWLKLETWIMYRWSWL